jgi:hypothetical protein
MPCRDDSIAALRKSDLPIHFIDSCNDRAGWVARLKAVRPSCFSRHLPGRYGPLVSGIGNGVILSLPARLAYAHVPQCD